ncbi:hypothetical protein LJC68_00120 [Bacteroidales bacterium OttesenSCG-928-B11]|nr:hypothetical protein [Bacteroidales bacterium OttesenSCG-928-E04]MDL2308405.1 hypothetical protein [Bacteroidales bacterium OttesenSCG-928-C03]MDL2311269.1 hypothetical protein [Bacteroidales bacterium OttesenSCG-928-B11]
MEKKLSIFNAGKKRFLTACMISFAVLFMTSCTKDGKYDGTTWTGSLSTHQEYVGGTVDSDFDFTVTFSSDDDVLVKLHSETARYREAFGDTLRETINKNYYGTYSSKKSNVELVIDTEIWSGTATEDEMTLDVKLTDQLIYNEKLVLTRQQ